MTEKGIKLGNILWSDKNMEGGNGKEIDGVRYYTFQQAVDTAKEQGLVLPTKQDFIDSGFTEERDKDNKKLADKLGLTLDGWCESDGGLYGRGACGYRWSASPRDDYSVRTFGFDKDKGTLSRDGRSYGGLPVRPVLENPSKSDNLTIGQFSNEELLKEISKRMKW